MLINCNWVDNLKFGWSFREWGRFYLIVFHALPLAVTVTSIGILL
jgi:hypothetical protein